MRQHKLQAVLVILFFAFLFLPKLTMMLNPNGHLAQSAKLSGIVSATEFPRLSADGWLSGKYQQQYAEAFGKIFGWRAWLIRFSNQVYYTVFQKSYMYDQNLIVGKNGMLYEKGYLLEYCGLFSAPGDEVLQKNVAKLALLQSKLAQKGITFAVLISPSKASIYPENIPATFMDGKRDDPRMYDKLLALYRQAGVRYVDGHAITLAEKSRATGPVFGEGGTHWTTYAASFTVDQLIATLAKDSGHVLPRIERHNVRLATSAIGPDPDLDLAALLNLLYPPANSPLSVATFTRAPHSPPPQKTILFMGDSFTWIPLDLLHENQVFRQMDFYYYYRRMKATYVAGEKHTVEPEINVEKIQWDRDIFNHDYMVLSLNEIYMHSDHLDAFVSDALKNLQ